VIRGLMKLSFIIEQARSGELAGLSDKKYTDRTIVSYINLAMIALYNRFELATEEAIITLRPDIPKTVYTLASSDEDVKVAGHPIVDYTFKNIVAAFNEDGTEIGINSETDPFSIYTVAYNKVQVPLLSTNTYISVLYRCNPEAITFVDDGNGNAVDTEVAMPTQLLEAALHYIGYRAHGALNGNVQAENSTHYTRYLAACALVDTLGVITANSTDETTVAEKGYA